MSRPPGKTFSAMRAIGWSDGFRFILAQHIKSPHSPHTFRNSVGPFSQRQIKATQTKVQPRLAKGLGSRDSLWINFYPQDRQCLVKKSASAQNSQLL